MNERDIWIFLDGECFEDASGKFIEPERVTMVSRGQPDIESAKQIAADAEEYRNLNKHGVAVPRWRMVVETGQGYDELTDEEKRLAKEYICTDQAQASIESFRKMGEEIGRRHAELVDAAVMRAIGRTP